MYALSTHCRLPRTMPLAMQIQSYAQAVGTEAYQGPVAVNVIEITHKEYFEKHYRVYALLPFGAVILFGCSIQKM
jgi:hypothetical protein